MRARAGINVIADTGIIANPAGTSPVVRALFVTIPYYNEEAGLPELLGEMMTMMGAGADVVYGKRRNRARETKRKKVTAKAFYRLLATMIDFDIPTDAGDFRLMSRRVLEALLSMPETHRFIRGTVSWIGFTQVPLE